VLHTHGGGGGGGGGYDSQKAKPGYAGEAGATVNVVNSEEIQKKVQETEGNYRFLSNNENLRVMFN